MGAAVSNLYYPAIDRTVGRHNRAWSHGDRPRRLSAQKSSNSGRTSCATTRRKQAEKLARQGGVQTTSQPAPQSAAPVPPSPQP